MSYCSANLKTKGNKTGNLDNKHSEETKPKKIIIPDFEKNEKLREIMKNLPHFPKSDSQESENKGTISKKNYSLLQFVNDIPQFKP